MKQITPEEPINTVSQFEYVIMELADPERAGKCRPRTDEEEYQARIGNLKQQASKLTIKKS